MRSMYITPVVKQILIGCIVFFAGTYLLQARGIIDLNMVLAMYYPNSEYFKPWQIITHMFMHGGISHILFNMLALVSIGTFLERFMGAKKFLQLYFFSGLGAVFIHVLSQFIQIHHITGLWFPSTEDIGIKLFSDMDTGQLMVNTNGSYIREREDLRIFGPVVGASGAIYGVVAAFAFLFPNTELMIMFIPYPIKAKYL